jgi:hypothetical protein
MGNIYKEDDMQKWEYTELYVDMDLADQTTTVERDGKEIIKEKGIDNTILLKYMNQLGDEGWEIAFEFFNTLFFKRPKPNS